MDAMPNHPHLTRRGNVFWLRRKVPADLRDHYAPKTHIARSLRTTDPKAALCKVRKEAVQLDEEFERIRRLRDVPVQNDLSAAEIARLIAIHQHNHLEADEEARQDGMGGDRLLERAGRAVTAAGGEVRFTEAQNRRSVGMTEREFIKTGETLEFVTLILKAALARGDTSVVSYEVDELLEVGGIKLAANSPSYRKLALEVLKADVRAYEAMAARQAGEPVDTPPRPATFNAVPQVAPTRDGEITLSGLWGRYVAERKPPPKTVSDFGTYVRRFCELNGDLPVRTVTKAHVRDFKDAMLQLPTRVTKDQRKLTVPQLLERLANDTSTPRLNPNTVNEKALGAISAVFGYAVDNGYRDDNPARGIKATGPTSYEPARLPYSLDDLQTIFSSRLFTENLRPVGGGGEAAKWLPLLALFSGARLEELGRLEVEDIREEQGIPYLFIHTRGEGRRVKTRQSRRRVPVHPELVSLGFLEYVAERRRAGDAKLFPLLKSKRTEVTAAFSTWWGRYTDSIGLSDKRKVFHSFRHLVKRALRDAGVDPTLRDALQGHRARDVAEKYGLDEEGFGFSLPALYAGLSKLAYPGLDLSHLVRHEPLPAAETAKVA